MTRTIPFAFILAGCSVDVSTTAGAITSDPGATTLAFHSPTGISVDIRTVAPAGQADRIFLKYSGNDPITGQPIDAVFQGTVVGSADATWSNAAIAPIAAVLLGVTTSDQVQESLSLSFTKVQFKVTDQRPPCDTSVGLVQQAADYVLLDEGPAAGALATSYIATLGIGPCLKKI